MDVKEKIIDNRLIGHPEYGIYKMVLQGEIAKSAEPGQFVHIRVSEANDPLLRRPLSIAGIDREKEEITIYYRVAGKGTELLSKLSIDEKVSVLGPLGKGFTLPQQGELLLIAGGIGVFPLYAVIQAANKANLRVRLLWGTENKNFLESADISYLRTMGADVEISTLDGSEGHKGLVTDLLNKYLTDYFNGSDNANDANQSSDDNRSNDNIPNGDSNEIDYPTPRIQMKAAACGPKGMLKAVTEICLKYQVEIEVSLEERMACGVGACLGCVCTVKDEAGDIKRKRVCKEGPVLDGKEVIWDAES